MQRQDYYDLRREAMPPELQTDRVFTDEEKAAIDAKLAEMSAASKELEQAKEEGQKWNIKALNQKLMQIIKQLNTMLDEVKH